MTPAPAAETPTIFISAYRNYSVRYLLYSDVFAELRKGELRLVLFFKDKDIETWRARFEGGNVVVEPVLYAQAMEILKGHGVWRTLFGMARRLMSGSAPGFRNTTGDLNLFTYALPPRKLAGRILFAMSRGMAAAGRRVRLVRRLILGAETLLFPGRLYDPYFEKYRPRMLVVSSIGYMIDPYFMRAAHRHGCQVVSIVHSVDNPTTKDYRGGDPDHVVTWNENMKREVNVFHDVPLERIHVGGVAHWDGYFDGRVKPRPRAEFLQAYGLRADRRLLFYGTSNSVLFRNTFDVFEGLLQRMEKGELGPAQLLVRLHPQYLLPEGGGQVIDRYRPRMEAMEKRYGDLVRFTLPLMKLMQDDVDMPMEDMYLLAEILKHCDVLLTEYSTLMLEGAIFDVPTVNVALHNFRDTDQPAALFEQFTHIKRLLSTGAARSAFTMDTLVQLVNEYLQDRGKDADNRRILVDQEITTNRGTAGREIARQLRAWAAEG